MTMEDDPSSRYAFGDAGLAADRLGLLHEVFTAPSRTLLRVAPPGVGSAVDIGCGPGYSTQLLADELRPVHLAGLDTSDAFLALARTSGPPASWYRHDATVVPFPCGRADVVHARFVLSHLPEPEATLLAWLGQVRPGGFLLVLEDDAIRSTDPTLVAYEEMVRSLVAHRGAELWVGERLARIEPPERCEVVVNRRVTHEVPVADAARLFSMNFSVWRHDPFVTGSRSDGELQALGEALQALARGGGTGRVAFDLRLIAYRRNVDADGDGDGD